MPKREGRTDLALIADAFTPRTRLLAISDVEYQDGFRNDLVALGKLCRDNAALFVVDASQSLGSIPCDAAAWQADVVMAVGYKWLAGMHGIAALAIDGRVMERIRPTAPGRLGVASGWWSEDYTIEWLPDAKRYQTGAPNWLGILALAESLGLQEELGVARSFAQGERVIDRLIAGLQERGVAIVSDLAPARRSHILTFTTGTQDGDASLARRLAERDVIISLRPRGIRAAAHYWNTTEDADNLLAALD
ncbi:MAG: aminotransferase class V-fold PLP-dependent enzyme [Thermomicrobiales bacterium]